MPEKKYIVVGLEEVMRILSNTNDLEIKEELTRLYSSEAYNELGKIRIYRGSKLYDVFKKDDNITIENLTFALTRAYYECNISVRNKLAKYIHRFLDNIKNEINNEMLICQIRNDKEIINYIQKFHDWDDYSQELISKKTKQKSFVIQQNEQDKVRSYVMM